MTNPLIEAANQYLDLGLSIIALSGKTPNGRVHRHGLKEAVSADSVFTAYGREGALERMFGHRDTTGIGILTSYPLVVVDIDSENGAQNWKALAGLDEFIQQRWVARTAKGLHLYMATFEATGTFKPFGNDGGVDLKGDGGYVAAPPSWHPGDEKLGIPPGQHYEWVADPVGPLLIVPDPLAAKIREHNFEAEGRRGRAAQQKRIRHEPLEDGILYASWGFEHLFEGMKNAADGNRNNYLHWAAAVMAEDGAGEDEFEQLREVALQMGLTRLEVKRTIRSGRTRG